MGCDYYICKSLEIHYFNSKYPSIIELKREKGYFIETYDEDQEDYETVMNENRKNCMIPRMKPILIYTNNTFLNPTFEKKYKTIIEEHIVKYFQKWKNIKEIKKIEERYLR